jgi:Ferritin-like domain
LYEKKFITQAVARSGETQMDRRKLFAMVGLAGVGAAAAAAIGAEPASAEGVSDATVLNFALNLEYLEAEFYLRAVTGEGLPTKDTTGTGNRGGVSGGKKVHFKNQTIKKYAAEIAREEHNHVKFLRAALGSAAVSRPSISLDASFTAAATAAGVIKKGQKFDAFANEETFLFGAFLFEDVGVTAYKGAAGLITNKTYLDAAAGILAVEAYHAGIIRHNLYQMGLADPAILATVAKLSDARDSLDGSSDDDRHLGTKHTATLVPADLKNSIAFGRTPGQVLNIVYLNPKSVSKGGFYPAGMNGAVATSAGSAS